MAKKKRKQMKPWCWYCEREFEDELVLINHQKARHFKCSECNKRLNTANGMVIHVGQVHKIKVTKVPNALPKRDNPDIEIYGMDGIPAEDLAAHNQAMEGESGDAKKAKTDQSTAAASAGGFPPGQYPPGAIPGHPMYPYGMPPGYPYPPPQYGAPGMPPIPYPYGAPPPTSGPPGQRPPMPPVPGYPMPPFPGYAWPPPPGYPRPPFPPGGAPAYPPSVAQPGSVQLPAAAPTHSLISPTTPIAPSTPGGVPMSAASTHNSVPDLEPAASATEPSNTADSTAVASSAPVSGKPEKKTRFIYDDNDISPEEKRALLTQYRFTAEEIKAQAEKLDTAIESRLADLKGTIF
ncbi:hypothetical protein H4R33_006685 [Dimargaris cristalligena]|nr:hypothetical protein H4R33_006685 [Dimargaris cristalligena]